MIRRPPRSTPLYSSAASDVYKRQTIPGERTPTPDPCPSACEGGVHCCRGREKGHFSAAAGVPARVLPSFHVLAVLSTYWPVFSVARTCCASWDVFRVVGRFCPVSTFWRSVHVSATYWPVFSVARTCCASRTFSVESGVFARFPRFGVLWVFPQRIGQFSASRARAALVWTFSAESVVFARFPRFGNTWVFPQRIGQFSASRRTSYASRTFPTE